MRSPNTEQSWDKDGFSDRLGCTIKMARLEDYDSQLMDEIKCLYEYRNRCAHDVPRLHGQPGEWLAFERKRGMRNKPYGEGWRQVGESMLPLGFGDALSAVKTHDKFIDSFQSILPLMDEYLLDGWRTTGFFKTTHILGIFGEDYIRQLECLAADWEKVKSELKKIPQSEREEFAKRREAALKEWVKAQTSPES